MYQECHEPMKCEMMKLNYVSEGRDVGPSGIKGASSANNSKSYTNSGVLSQSKKQRQCWGCIRKTILVERPAERKEGLFGVSSHWCCAAVTPGYF